jgi:hypothetical protein
MPTLTRRRSPDAPQETWTIHSKRTTKKLPAGTGSLIPARRWGSRFGKGPAMDSQTNREIWFQAIGTIITVSFVISLVLVFISAIR